MDPINLESINDRNNDEEEGNASIELREMH